MMPAEVLAKVSVVVHSHSKVACLEHVAREISSYLDDSLVIPFHRACSNGSLRLLDRIWANSFSVVQLIPKNGASWSLCQYLRTDIHYYRYQFCKSLCAAVGRNDVDVVRWIFGHFSGCTTGVEVVEEAARCGRLDILELLLERSHQVEGRKDGNSILWGRHDVQVAIEAGQSDIARWLLKNTPGVDRELNQALKLAVRQRDVPIIRVLVAEIYHDTSNTIMSDATAESQMETLTWACEQGYDERPDKALVDAATNGRLDMVQWYVTNGIVRRAEEALQSACSRGHFSTIQWLVTRNFGRGPSRSINSAIRAGYLEIVEFLHEQGITDNPFSMMMEAASNGQLDVVKWLYEKYGDAPENLFPALEPSQDQTGISGKSAMDRAAANGHFRVLKYLHHLEVTMQADGKRGPTVSEWAFVMAAAGGHINIMEWLHCNYASQCHSTNATTMAARSGQLKAVQWLHHHTDIKWTTAAMDEASANGHLNVVQWLHNNRTEGCTTSAMNEAAHYGHLNIVRWLHANRSEGCTADAMDLAASLGHFEVLLFLHSQRVEGCTLAAKLGAQERKHAYLLAWLEENYPDERW